MKFILVLLFTGFFLFASPIYAEEKILPIPLLGQERNLSCEAAATRMVLAYFGKHISEQEILNSFSFHPNPHLGFRGKVDGKLFSYQDYGIYAHPVAHSLSKFGVGAQPYTNISESFLKEKILAGKPAIIWINGTNRGSRYETIDGQKVKLVLGEHTVVVTGYDDGVWILNDPWQKTVQAGKRTPTQRRVKSLDSLGWHHFDRMAVIVD